MRVGRPTPGMIYACAKAESMFNEVATNGAMPPNLRHAAAARKTNMHKVTQYLKDLQNDQSLFE